MSLYPSPTTGLGVAANILVAGNNGATVKPTVPGYNDVTLSVTGATYNGVVYTETFQLNPQLVDASGAEVNPGTSFAITSVATGTGVYTGTIGVKSNSLVGQTFVVTGFVTNPVNNGTFICTANNGTTTITLDNAASVSESATAAAKSQESSENVFVLSAAGNASGGVTVYTGTIGVASSSLIGKSFLVSGFDIAANNGTFVCTANNGSTTMTLANASGASDTHAGLATGQLVASELTYVAYPAKTLTTGTSNPYPVSPGTAEAVATVSASGLVTSVAPGGVEVEVSYPTFDNAIGDIVSSGNPMNGLPINKIYASVNVTVLP